MKYLTNLFLQHNWRENETNCVCDSNVCRKCQHSNCHNERRLLAKEELELVCSSAQEWNKYMEMLELLEGKQEALGALEGPS